MKIAEPLTCTWEELRKTLRVLWGQTTSCANWMITELYSRDIRRDAATENLAPMPRAYLYPEARSNFPDLPPQTVASLEQACQRKYRALRRDVVWTHAASLPTFRYPTPFPVHNQSWKAEPDAGKRPIVSIRFADGWKQFRLKGGPHYRRQVAAFNEIISGDAQAGELAILSADAIQVKMVAWFPRAPKQHGGTLTVSTQKDCLLLAINAKDETLWRYNGDHLKRWIGEHRARLQRWSEDQKFEQHRNEFRLRRSVATFQQRREDAVKKHANRMASAMHEIAFQLATYAKRRHFAVVQYDDSEHGFLGDQAPWFRLRQMLGETLDRFGIDMTASASGAPKDPGTLAGETNHVE